MIRYTLRQLSLNNVIMPVFDHFGFIAPYYDRLIRRSKPEKLLAQIDPPVSGFLLDVGGGTGRVAETLLGRTERVIVADLSMGMLQQARVKNNLAPVCASSENLPFASNFFDRILMVDAFHHVLDQRQSAEELWRILKSGGRLVIEEPDIHRFATKIVAILEKLAFMRSHFKSPQEIESLFRYPDAKTRIVIDQVNAWIIVEKISTDENQTDSAS